MCESTAVAWQHPLTTLLAYGTGDCVVRAQIVCRTEEIHKIRDIVIDSFQELHTTAVRVIGSHAFPQRSFLDRYRTVLANTVKEVRNADRLVEEAGSVLSDRLAGKLKALVNELLHKLGDAVLFAGKEIEQALDDFQLALENEDRFVIVVFGMVNSGKSALGNHIAGLDFAHIVPPIAECFQGPRRINRLPEGPTEETREYQGFRLPGILWIDCPGTGSTTIANEELARRLTARADIVLFVTSSDAPMMAQELKELSQLVGLVGNSQFDARVVVTKADTQVFQGSGQKAQLIRKDADQAQITWIKKQLRSANLDAFTINEPLVVSVYLARDALGLKWHDAVPKKHWQSSLNLVEYKQSGVLDVIRALCETIEQRGVELKRQWPEKRFNIIANQVQPLMKSVLGQLEDARAKVNQMRTMFCREMEGVKIILEQDIERYVQKKLLPTNEENIQYVLQKCEANIRKKIESSVGRLLKKALRDCDEVIKRCAERIKLRVKIQRHKITVTGQSRRSANAGRGFSAAIGAAVGGFFFGPVGALIGAALGVVVDYVAGRILPSNGERKKGVAVVEPWKEFISRVARQVAKDVGNQVDKFTNEVDISLWSALLRYIDKLKEHCENLMISLHRKERILPCRRRRR